MPESRSFVTRRRPFIPWRVLGCCALLALESCQTTANDIRRWGTTENGPAKLSSVLTHRKYDVDLRVEAALTLIGMEPRGGRRIGIDRLLETLEDTPQPLRQELLPPLVTNVVKRLAAPPTEAGEDPTIAYKDTAYALLQHEQRLIQDAEQRRTLESALMDWAMKDFVKRLDAPTQRVSMQQMLSDLGPRSVEGLPPLIVPDAQKTDQIVRIIADVGSAETKLAAAEQLVTVTRYAASAAWREARSKELEQQDPKAFEAAGPKTIQKHLLQLQEEEVLRQFASLRRLGGSPTVDFLLQFAFDAQYPEKARLGALAALESHVEKAPDSVANALLDFAMNEKTPETLRGAAFVRAGEVPLTKLEGTLRKAVLEGGMAVRLAAAELWLGKAKKEEVPDFLATLGKAGHLGVGEPLRYGRLLGNIEGFDSSVLDSYINKRSAPAAARLTALGYYYAYGTKAELAQMERMGEDGQAVPECAEGEEACNWRCGEQSIDSVGAFFRHCVAPHMAERSSRPTE